MQWRESKGIEPSRPPSRGDAAVLKTVGSTSSPTSPEACATRTYERSGWTARGLCPSVCPGSGSGAVLPSPGCSHGAGASPRGTPPRPPGPGEGPRAGGTGGEGVEGAAARRRGEARAPPRDRNRGAAEDLGRVEEGPDRETRPRSRRRGGRRDRRPPGPDPGRSFRPPACSASAGAGAGGPGRRGASGLPMPRTGAGRG